jgi:uncharacterized membrane protein YkvA (DUF1232 family)
MTVWEWLALTAGVALILYAAFIGWILVTGRCEAARAVAGFIPDCITLFRRLLQDPRVPRRSKLLLVGLIGYLALPFDLVPDFIPVAGQLDDAILIAAVLRKVLRSGGREVVAEHWPGPASSLALLTRLAYGTQPV